VLRENSIQPFSTQCNIVTFDHLASAALTFIFLNVADFKGNRAGQHFGEGQVDWILLRTAIFWAQLPRGQLQS
jgi:hypothetical protein